MRMLLGILGAILIALGAVGAVSAAISAIYDKTVYDNTLNCIAGPPDQSGAVDTMCFFEKNPSSADHQFNQNIVVGVLGGSVMITGGCLVAGACALSGRGAKRQDTPPYAGPQPAYSGQA